jgi:hypothetical protein
MNNINDVELPTLIESYPGELIKSQIKWIAGEHIVSYYPYWKQLNIISGTDDVEKNKMHTFIDSVRTWSNNNPVDIYGVSTIRPV